MNNSKLYSILALAGTAPFVACALLPVFEIDSIPFLGALDAVASSYGLAIVCFLAGAHWGVYLSTRTTTPFNLFASSNIIFLATWFAYIGASLTWAIVMQIIAFQALLYIDYRLKGSAVISNPYFRIRSIATAIATFSLLVILLS